MRGQYKRLRLLFLTATPVIPPLPFPVTPVRHESIAMFFLKKPSGQRMRRGTL
jgi:hypothetical protein